MSKRIIILVTFALVALVTGCGGKYDDYTPSASDLTLIAERYDGDDKEIVQATALHRYLVAENARAESEKAQAQIAALEATKAAALAAEQRQYIALTAQAQDAERAIEATRQTKLAWATQQSANATQVTQATAMALSVQMTSQSMAIEATAEQRAYEATATSDTLNRQATATAEARSYEATATAQYRADVATATQQAYEAKVTSTAESVQATKAAYSATATRAAEKRELTLGAARDFGIPVVLLLLGAGMVGFLIYAARQHAKRPVVVERSILGDAQPMMARRADGGWDFIDQDLAPGPVLSLRADGTVAAPLLRSPQREERDKARDQILDLASRPKLGPGHKGTGQAPTLPAPPEAPAPGLRSVRVLRRLDQAGRAGFIAPPLLASLEADWEVEQ